MRFHPSEALAEAALELQLEENTAEKDREKVLPVLLAFLGQADQKYDSMDVVSDAVRNRLSSAITILTQAEREKEAATLMIWNENEFTQDVRCMLATLLAVDSENPQYEIFLKQLAQEFGTWSEEDPEGMSEVKLERENGSILRKVPKKADINPRFADLLARIESETLKRKGASM